MIRQRDFKNYRSYLRSSINYRNVFEVLLILLVGLVPLIWFKDGLLIDFHDFNFSLRPIINCFFYTWKDISAPGFENTRHLAEIFYRGFIAIPTKLGLSLVIMEKIYFVLIFILSGLSMYSLTSTLIPKEKRGIAPLASAFFYMFNPFIMNYLWHILFLIDFYALFPLIFSLYIKGLREERFFIYSFLISAIFAVILSHAMVNPVSFVIGSFVLFLYLIAYIIDKRKDRHKIINALKFNLALAIIWLCFNSWWLLPQISALSQEFSSATGATEDLGITTRSILELESKRSTLLNVFRLGGGWAFNEKYKGDAYVSYAPVYSTTIFQLISFFIPILIFYGLLKKEGVKHSSYFGVLAIIGLFLVKGTQPPFGGAFLWMFINIPLFTIFRHFQDKFNPIVVLSYAFLFGIGINHFIDFLRSRKIAFNKQVIAIASAVIFITIFGIYSYPMWTGEVIPNRGGITPSAHIKVPEYYAEADIWLKNQKDDFKIFSLPFSRLFYAVYNWEHGYIGGDPSGWLFSKPTIAANTGKSFDIPLQIATVLSKGELNSEISKILALLNVKYLLFHDDANWEYIKDHPWWLSSSPKRDKSILNHQKGICFEKSFGKLDLYKISDDYFLPHIYPASGNATIVTGNTNSLIPLTYTPYLDGYPALAFTEQQNENGLLSLVGGKRFEVGGKKWEVGGKRLEKAEAEMLKVNEILFANRNFNDLVIDLAKAEAQPDSRQSTVGSQMPILVKLDREGRGKYEIKEDGVYDIWLRSDVKGIEGIGAIRIDKETYPIIKEDIKGKWLRVGSKRFKPRWWGQHKIKVITKRPEVGGLQDIEVVVVSEGKRKVYEDLLRSKELSYLFYKEEGDSSGTKVSKPIGKREFYIPKGGEYEIKALIRPKKEKVRAYIINERFYNNKLEDWDFRIVKGEGRESEARKASKTSPTNRTNEDLMPFLFGENLYPPQSISYPPYDGMWRWMSDDGKIIIFNPFNEPLKVDISFSIASFKEGREVRIFLNADLLKTLTLPGPEEKVDKRFLKEASDLKALLRASGKPEKVKIRGLLLRPGMNEMVFRPIPSATIVGKDNRFFVSIALSDDFRVGLSSEESGNQSTTYWTNRDRFDVKVEEGVLIFKDDYKGNKEEIGWVTRRFDEVDLYETPLFIVKYSWSDNEVQAMEVGFRIDTDGDGKENLYFTRTIPHSVSNVNRFEIDLLEEVWRVFPDTDIGKAYLVGIDLFPHRKWGLDISRTIKEGICTYQIKGVQVASTEASVVVDEESFKGFKGSEKATYTVSQDNRGLVVSLPLGGRKGDYASTEFTVPLRYKLLREYPLIILPFQLTDKDVQGISLWVGYDTLGDGRVDRFLPLGVRVPILSWRLITKDMKEPMLLYESRLPEGFPAEYTTKGRAFNNFIVLKDGKPLSLTWDNDFRIAKEQVQVEGKKVVINLPRNKDPDGYNYELYYVPERWVIDSPRFPGFKEYAFEMEELKESLPDMGAIPVELKLVLEGRVSKFLDEEKEFKFYFKAPMYTHTVLPRLKSIEQERNMPAFKIDDRLIYFVKKETDNEKEGIWLKRTEFFKEGNHTLYVREQAALEAYVMEIKPVSSPRKEIKDFSRGRQQSVVSSHEVPKIEFKKINPTRYVVNVKGAKNPFTLVFSESFHEGWKAYIRHRPEVRGQRLEARDWGQKAASNLKPLSSNNEPWSALWSAWKDKGKRIEVKNHFVVNGYANGWIVPIEQMLEVRGKRLEGETIPEDFQIVVEFKPQRLFEVGLIVSAITLLGCIGYLGYGLMRLKVRGKRLEVGGKRWLRKEERG